MFATRLRSIVPSSTFNCKQWHGITPRRISSFARSRRDRNKFSKSTESLEPEFELTTRETCMAIGMFMGTVVFFADLFDEQDEKNVPKKRRSTLLWEGVWTITKYTFAGYCYEVTLPVLILLGVHYEAQRYSAEYRKFLEELDEPEHTPVRGPKNGRWW